MDTSQLNAYRQLGLDQLEKLMTQLPEQPHEVDEFVDESIRKLSDLPARTTAQPYVGLYGQGSTLNDYRDVAVDRLQDLLMKLPQVHEVDKRVDHYIRLLSDLPDAPTDAIPYSRLFVLRPQEPDELKPDADDTKQFAPKQQLITTEQLIQIAGTEKFKARLTAFTPGINTTFAQYNINTKLRMAHFLAQVMHESGGFQWLKEIWGPTDVQRRYEGRKDLGNTQAGDGKRFMGRGLIQLTGRSNYNQFSKAIGVDCMVKPELVESPPYAVLVAGWFWDSRKINALADKDDLVAVTRRVNGGKNGLDDRAKYLKRAKLVLK